MTFKFACPKCKKSIKATSDVAGKVAKCPGCGAKLRIPTPKPAAAGAARSKSRSGSATSKPKSKPKPKPPADDGMLPFDDSEWEAALSNPFESPQADEPKKKKLPSYDDPKKVSRKSLKWAKRGLTLVSIGLNGIVLCMVTAFAMRFISGGEDPGAGVKALAIVAIIVYAVCGLLLFVGPFLCLLTPSNTGAKSSAIAACVAQTMLVVLVFALAAVQDDSERNGVTLLILIASGVSYFGFLNYCNQLARHLGREDIAGSASLIMGLGVASIVLMILLRVAGALLLPVVDMLSDWLEDHVLALQIVFGGIGLVFFFLFTAALVLYANATRRLVVAIR